MFRLNKQALLGTAFKSSILAEVAEPVTCRPEFSVCCIQIVASFWGQFSAKKWSQNGLLPEASLFSYAPNFKKVGNILVSACAFVRSFVRSSVRPSVRSKQNSS